MKLSVLLPVYNGGDLLERAIDSILNQEFEDFEFIIIDDASKDGSTSTIRRKASRDSRIKTVLHEKNMGLAATLNEGLNIASSPYVARMDHDDESLPSRLGMQYVFMKSRPRVAVAGCFPYHMGITPEMDRLVGLPQDAPEVKQALRKYNCLYHPSVILNRKMVLEIGGYRPELQNAEDYDLWLRLSRRHDLVNIPVPLLRYHFTASGLTLSRKWEQLYYTLLAQTSFRHPGKPWREIERIAKKHHLRHNKEEFLSNVLRGTMNELLSLGWEDEARQLMEFFVRDLGREKAIRISESLLINRQSLRREDALGKDLPDGQERMDENSTRDANGHGPYSGASGNTANFRGKRGFDALFGRSRFGILGLKQKRDKRKKPSNALTALIFVTLMLPSLIWIARDEHVWPWDQAWYAEVSVDLWFNLTHHLTKWLPEMGRAFGIKAPGVAWLGQFFVPLGQWMGSIEKGLLCSVVVVQLGTLGFIYRIGMAFGSKRRMVAYGGVLVVAAAPLFVAMSHQYFTEGLQLFGISYFYFLAVKAREMKREKLLAHLLVATSIALLAKVTSPIYCLLPGAMAAWGFFQRRDRTQEKRFRMSGGAWTLMAASAVLTAGCVMWYVINFKALHNFIKMSSSGDVALAYGTRAAFLPKLWFWLRAMQLSFQLPEVIVGELVLIAVAAIIFLVWPSKEKGVRLHRFSRLDLLAAFSAFHIAGVLAIFSLNINQENRYLLPLLPAVATVTMWVLGRIRQPAIIAGFLVLFGYQWVVVCAQALVLRSPNLHISYWILPYDRSDIAKKEITRLVDRTSTAQSAWKYNIVGVELPWLNANSLAFYAAKKELQTRRRSEYTSLGYAEGNNSKAWDRLESLHIVYFISLEESAQPDTPNIFNQVSVSILKRVREDRNFIPEPFNSKLGIVLFRNQTGESGH